MQRTILGKNLPTFLAYVVFGALTLAASVTLLIWTISGEVERAVQTLPAQFVAEGEWQTEYLVGQQFNPEGISVEIDGGKKIPAAECSVSADFTAAGKRTVELSYKLNDYTVYVAREQVTVIAVRAIYVENYSTYLTPTESGFAPAEDFAAYAVLAGKPQTNAFSAAEQVANGYKIRLNEGDYRTSCKPNSSLPSFYTATLYCGTLTHEFHFYNAAERSFIVSSATSVVPYQNVAGGAEALHLVVTERAESYQIDCTGKTAGTYIYTAADGVQTSFPFAYELKEKEEIFSSRQQTNTLVESTSTAEEGVRYEVSYGEKQFCVNADIFQNAVVGGRIYEDHGYKLVVGAKERILQLTYSPANKTDVKDPAYDASATEAILAEEGVPPTLTLYVTAYDMNPLLGTGNGWSRGVYIYTDRAGQSHKLPFYLQAWVWTFVPLSQNEGDAYDTVTVSDYVYNYEAPVDLQYNSYYQGTFYASVSQFVRGEGVVNERFCATDEVDETGKEVVTSESKWLRAILGM